MFLSLFLYIIIKLAHFLSGLLFDLINVPLKIKLYLILLIGVIALVFSSCTRREGRSLFATASFNAAILNAEHLFDSGKKQEALSYISRVYDTAKNLSVEDKMNYFAYVNTIYADGFNNHYKSIFLADSMLRILDEEANVDLLPARYVQAYNVKAVGYLNNGMFKEAYNYFYKAHSLASQTADSCSMAAFTRRLGIVIYRQQNYVKAISYFKSALSEVRYCPDEFTYFYMQQELLDNIGLSYMHLQQFDSAYYYYDTCLKFVRANYNKYPNKAEKVYETAEAVVLGNIGDMYMQQKKMDSAKLLLNRSIAINIQKGYANVDAALNQLKLAQIYLDQDSLTVFNKLLLLLQSELDSIHDINVKKKYLNLQFISSERQKDFSKANYYYKQYVSIRDSVDHVNQQLMNVDILGRLKELEHEKQLHELKLDRKTKDAIIIGSFIGILIVLSALLIISIYARQNAKNLNKIIVLNKELEHTLAKLQQRDIEKTRILRSVAHDVMSPISSIAALIDIIQFEGNNLTPDQLEMLELMREACGSSLNLSKDIIDAADSIQDIQIVKEPTDIVKLIDSAIELLRIRAAEKEQNIQFAKPSDPITAVVNKALIWRAVNNLLVNAIKFSHLKSTIEISINVSGEMVTIAVKDFGIGIAQNKLGNIFDMFTESRMYGTSGEKPHGIGLSICLQTAKLHGGNIHVLSQEGEGSTFYFSFLINSPHL